MTLDLTAWVGRQETAEELIDPVRTHALSAALGEAPAAAALPPLHHWLYFWTVKPPAELGTDGHPAKGGFLPPVPLPRRMWAGGRLQFLQPLRIGERATRTSTILKLDSKSGRSGELVFVTVRHEIAGQDGAAIVEEQDLVYRAAAAPGSVKPPSADPGPPTAAWTRPLTPDPVLLFRYSALTMNGHRIHYDRPYAMDEEAYPGLVVHGPLQATLLAALAAERLGAPLSAFSFRGQSPAFDGAPLHLCGEPKEGGAELWTEQGGAKCMLATAVVRAA